MEVTGNYALIMPKTAIPSFPKPTRNVTSEWWHGTSICHLFYVTKFGIYILFLQSVSPHRHQMLCFASLGVRKWELLGQVSMHTPPPPPNLRLLNFRSINFYSWPLWKRSVFKMFPNTQPFSQMIIPVVYVQLYMNTGKYTFLTNWKGDLHFQHLFD